MCIVTPAGLLVVCRSLLPFIIRRERTVAKIISVEEAVAMIPDGATIMFGGFLGCGSAHHIIEALSNSGKKDFTIIGNDCGRRPAPTASSTTACPSWSTIIRSST